MGNETGMIGVIEVTVKGAFTTHHYLRAEWGDLGELTFPAFSRGATYEALDGRKVTMQKRGWLGSFHEMSDGGVVRGTANQPKLLRQDIVVQFDGQDYSLRPEGILKQGWLLLDAGQNIIMDIQPRGFFKQGAYLNLHSAIEIDLVAFAYYLVHMRKEEEAAAVSATTAS